VRPGDEATIEAICAAYLAAYQLRGTGDPSQFHALKAPRRLLGGFLPAGLNGELLGGYQSARRREAISDSTIRRELGALRAALNYGLKHDMTARIPVIEKPRESEPRAAYLRKDEEPRFWQAAQMWGQDKGPGGAALALFVALALDTAARRDAILGLTWERVHFDQELIDYRVPGRRVSRKRNTVVPINSRLMPLLRDAAARAPVDLAGRPVGRVLGCGEDIVKRRFRKFTADIGMPWVTPHVCRHTWASLAAQDGVPLFHIAKMLGDSVATVERTYAKLAPSDLHAVANRRFVGPTLRMV
jgi:integrase